jgi:hypothetical protein
VKADRAWKLSAILGLAAGSLVAAGMLLVAWSHNPSNEFHSPDGVHWNDWLTVGAAWFAAVAIPVTLIARALFTLSSTRSDPNDRDEAV